MGQQQSSHGDTAPAAVAPVKTSYYELLGIERQATEDEIKKAYRRKALELHPDRNHGNEEEATRQFAEIQAAHEVLSDPQERAWYDSHESAILRGGDVGDDHFEGNVRVTTAEEVTAMIGKFNGRVRFDDSPHGFFGFLRDAFATLASEEDVAANLEGLDVPDYPPFGHKDDTHDGLVQDFYRGWASFSTNKSFAWLDRYRLNEAPDRRVKRLMEKENKKFRDDGVRDFNDAVRALIAFVRKRDPRYTPNIQSEAERQRTLREASAAQAARARAANAAKLDAHVPDWTKAHQPEDEDETSEEESEQELVECVACHKTFKSEKQFEAHERSKKHQKAVQYLKRQMQKDNARLNLDEEVSTSGAVTPDAALEEIEEEERLTVFEALELEETSNRSQAPTHLDENFSIGADSHHPSKESADAREQLIESSGSGEDEDGDSDYAPRSQVESRVNGALLATSDEDDKAANGSKAVRDDGKNSQASLAPEKKVGKAAQKRAKKAVKAAEAEAEELRFKCAQCNAGFPSKTQLFQHIKDLKHAAPVPAAKGKGGRKK